MPQSRNKSLSGKIDVEEDQANHLEAECQPLMSQAKAGHEVLMRAHLHDGDTNSKASPGRPSLVHPLKTKTAQILREVYHIHLLEFPLPTGQQLRIGYDERCEFHHVHNHTTEDYKTL
ncbi:hypothetical protein CR513_51988, partial [Mucuna pruriens]